MENYELEKSRKTMARVGYYVIAVLTEEEEARAIKNPNWRKECIKCGILEPEEEGQPRKYTYLIPRTNPNEAVKEGQ